MNAPKIFEQIILTHNEYIKSLRGLSTFNKMTLSSEERIDRVAFHVIEEIIEMRRTYPRKFWKQQKQEIDIKSLIEETADVFLMARSMWLEVCNTCNITEDDFLQRVLDKARVNQLRRENGY